jgi:hypothetical protein
MKIRFDEGRLIFGGGKIIRLVDPVFWFNASGTNFNLSVTHLHDTNSCPGIGDIGTWLTINYPPENYSSGYRIRVSSFTSDLVACGFTYWERS